MSMWRPRFLKCMILVHKLQRMFNGFKIGQLNSERPLHQTAVTVATTKYGTSGQVGQKQIVAINRFFSSLFCVLCSIVLPLHSQTFL